MGHLAHGGEELLGRFNEDTLDFSIEDGGGGADTEHGGEADRQCRVVGLLHDAAVGF
jgi:hypothetical protein